MPGLLTLKTDLKSLKYGHDTPGGGDSGQPYIKTDINTVDSGFNRLRLTKFDDGLVRGGIVGSLNASVVDTIRIGKFLTDFPRGPLFIIKQVGLQLSNPRLEVPKNPLNIAAGGLNNVLSVGTNGLLQPTRIYNLGINTIAQIPINAFGGHLLRHGILPVQGDASKYEAVVTANNNIPFINNPSKNNRLITLANKFNLGYKKPGLTLNPNFFASANTFNAITNVASSLLGTPSLLPTSLSPNQDELIINKYFGGPESVYGLGNTIIKRSTFTADSYNNYLSKEQSSQRAGKTRNVDTGDIEEVNYAKVISTSGNAIFIATGKNQQNLQSYVDTGLNNNAVNYSNPSIKKYSDLVSQIQKQNERGIASPSTGSYNLNSFNQYSTDRNGSKVDNSGGEYNTNNNGPFGYQNTYGEKYVISSKFSKWSEVARENRIGSFGNAKVSGSNGTRELRAADSINLTPIFNKGSYWYDNSIGIGGIEYNIRDLVKFAIQAVNTNAPGSSDFMVFRAYLTQFSDSVDSKWTDVNYVGRGNPFYIYNGFNRKIQIGFKVAALSAEEMKPMYQKLNYLMSNLMPDYENNLMRGPLVRMTVGNYLDAQFGKLDSVSYTIPNDSPWEIALDEPEGGTQQLILPHILEVSLGFTPIGAETKQTNKIEEKSKTTSYLAQNNTGADAKTIQYID
jgi:hypothetical protein